MILFILPLAYPSSFVAPPRFYSPPLAFSPDLAFTPGLKIAHLDLRSAPLIVQETYTDFEEEAAQYAAFYFRLAPELIRQRRSYTSLFALLEVRPIITPRS